jgi:hypothetical protein
MSTLGLEDNFFEWMTFIFFILASGFFFLNFLKTKNLFFILFAALMVLGAGEEISWGQRVFGFKTPETINKINIQGEFTLHNIEIFNNLDYQLKQKHGLSRLLEINFLFRIFTMGFGIILPFFVRHFKFVSQISMRIKLPVPPISIGLFFFLNWVTYWVLHSLVLPRDSPVQYIDTAGEIFECLASFIFWMISIYFYEKRKVIVTEKELYTNEFNS